MDKPLTIRQLARVRKRSGDLGIEIEVEGRKLPGANMIPDNFHLTWNIDHDGSLRGESFEYVLVSPLPLDGVEKALQVLSDAYKVCGSTINDSVRTGVHVHVNCQELTMKQVMTFATLYYTLEELMLMFCNTSRRGNHFCLRAKDAEYLIFALITNLESGSLSSFNNDNLRYSSMNFCALPKFGSLEFRSLESPQDMDKILEWAGMLLHLKDMSLSFDDPQDVISSMSSDGYEGFVEHVIGPYYKHFTEVTDINGLLLSGVRQAQSLAYALNWKEVDEMWNVVPDRQETRRRRRIPPPPNYIPTDISRGNPIALDELIFNGEPNEDE